MAPDLTAGRQRQVVPAIGLILSVWNIQIVAGSLRDFNLLYNTYIFTFCVEVYEPMNIKAEGVVQIRPLSFHFAWRRSTGQPRTTSNFRSVSVSISTRSHISASTHF